MKNMTVGELKELLAELGITYYRFDYYQDAAVCTVFIRADTLDEAKELYFAAVAAVDASDKVDLAGYTMPERWRGIVREGVVAFHIR